MVDSTTQAKERKAGAQASSTPAPRPQKPILISRCFPIKRGGRQRRLRGRRSILKALPTIQTGKRPWRHGSTRRT